MTEVSQYPPGAQAADQNLFVSVEGLRKTVENGFDRIDRRMDSLVTKDAHLADIARLDQRIDHTDEKLEQGFKDLKRDMADGFSAISGRDAERDAAAKDRDDKRDAKFARRMTWTLTAVGLIFGLWSTFIAPLFQK